MDDFRCAAVDSFFAIRDPLTLGKGDGVRLHEVLQQINPSYNPAGKRRGTTSTLADHRKRAIFFDCYGAPGRLSAPSDRPFRSDACADGRPDREPSVPL